MSVDLYTFNLQYINRNNGNATTYTQYLVQIKKMYFQLSDVLKISFFFNYL